VTRAGEQQDPVRQARLAARSGRCRHESFGLEIEIPDREDCRAQRLLLYHHARSQSEELISGEIIFRDIRLMRLKQSESAVAPPSEGGADAEEARPD
jgi:hypothetical protein